MREKYQYAEPGYDWANDNIICKPYFLGGVQCQVIAQVGYKKPYSKIFYNGNIFGFQKWYQKEQPTTTTGKPKDYGALTMQPFPTNHRHQTNKAWLKWMRKKYQFARPGYNWVDDTLDCVQVFKNAIQYIVPTQECEISAKVSDEKTMGFKGMKQGLGIDWAGQKQFWDDQKLNMNIAPGVSIII